VPCSVARTFISRGVVLRKGQHGAELVAVAHQRRQAGEHLQVLGDADAGAAGAELLHLGVGDGDEPEAGQRVVDRHGDGRLAVGVDDDVRLPDQSVSNSSRAEPRPPPPPAATAFRP
jgi:hypothetical protein